MWLGRIEGFLLVTLAVFMIRKTLVDLRHKKRRPPLDDVAERAQGNVWEYGELLGYIAFLAIGLFMLVTGKGCGPYK